jgi:hypothetical protein
MSALTVSEHAGVSLIVLSATVDFCPGYQVRRFWLTPENREAHATDQLQRHQERGCILNSAGSWLGCAAEIIESISR